MPMAVVVGREVCVCGGGGGGVNGEGVRGCKKGGKRWEGVNREENGGGGGGVNSEGVNGVYKTKL